MVEPIRFSPTLEQPTPDEADVHDELNATFQKILDTTAKDYGRAVRGVHAKSHGLLTATLTVPGDLPAPYAQGVFSTPGQHQCIIRLSTNPGDILDDSVSVPRGFALKILGVEGERLPGAGGDTQDFVMANAPAFAAPNAAAFLKNLKRLAATTDTPQIFKKGLSTILRGVEATLEAVGTKSPAIIGLGGHPATNILGETFWSQVPVRWGDYVAKLSVVPVSPELKELHGAKVGVFSDKDVLRHTVADYFREHGAEWDIRAQLLTDTDTMPIEDASVVWPEDESPYVTIGRISAPPQDSWSDSKVRTIDEGLAFSPWHGIIAHQPLGSVMRARRTAYPFSARFRAEHNGCPIHEPTGATLPGL